MTKRTAIGKTTTTTIAREHIRLTMIFPNLGQFPNPLIHVTPPVHNTEGGARSTRGKAQGLGRWDRVPESRSV